MRIERRTFLKLLTMSSLGALTSSSVWSAERGRSRKKEVEWVPGVGRYAPTSCFECSGGCGIRVKRVMGNAVKVEGNTHHPLNGGGLCVRGQAALQVLYNPDRIKNPLRRSGPRGSDTWQEISWGEAINEVSSRLGDLRMQGIPYTAALMSGRVGTEGTPVLLDRFMKAYGSPNLIPCSTMMDESVTKAHYFTQGINEHLAYDFEKAKYVMVFGDVLSEGSNSTTHLMGSFSKMRGGYPGMRVKLLSIDPRLSPTAIMADEWVPVYPGTEGALALGIGHVLIKEDRYDKKFVEEYTFGFDDWNDPRGEHHLGFKKLVVEEYYPERVSELTGVSGETIVRIAKELSTHRPALVVQAKNQRAHTNALYNAVAIHCLNALLGNIQQEGGVLVQRNPPLSKLPEPNPDQIAGNGLSKRRIHEAMSSPSPFAPTVNALLIYHANPLYNQPNGKRFEEALSSIPFIVNFSPFMDETALVSDLILPDSAYLERWETCVINPSIGRAVLGVRQPVVKPLYNTLNTIDAFIQIARGIGTPVAAAFPWKNAEDFVKERVEGLRESGRGSITTRSRKRFWEKLLVQGCWWEKEYPYGNPKDALLTASRRFEFFSQTMRQRFFYQDGKELSGGERDDLIRELGITVRGDKVFLPHYEPPRFVGEEGEKALHLFVHRTSIMGSGGGANQPVLQEIFGNHEQMTWDSWVEINPETGRESGLNDGDQVWVESPKGKVKVTVKFYAGAMPNVVYFPLGQGHRAYGRYAQGRGSNPLEIAMDEFDRLSGAPALCSTRVKLYKA
jgi:anaerobic selenocysteine-containing dehydrogenase